MAADALKSMIQKGESCRRATSANRRQWWLVTIGDRRRWLRAVVEASIRSAAIQAVLSSEKETVASSAGSGGVLRKKLNKVVLAYSGGLDTSVIVPWLRENYGCEVVCFTADVGQGVSELKGLEEKAKASGACQLVVKDLREEFVKDYIYPCLRAGAIYERKYLLGTSMARPVIAKEQSKANIANREMMYTKHRCGSRSIPVRVEKLIELGGIFDVQQ